MKRIFLLFLNIICLFFNTNLTCSNQDQSHRPQPKNSQPLEDNTHETLGRVANMVNLFSNIIANPNDSKNVAISILGMISTIFTMAADTRSITTTQSNLNELNLEDITNILEHGSAIDIYMLQSIVRKYCELQIIALDSYIQN